MDRYEDKCETKYETKCETQYDSVCNDVQVPLSPLQVATLSVASCKLQVATLSE